MFKKLLLLLLLIFSGTSFSQNINLTDNAKVSIFTCGRGNELYTTFGHTAIRIKDEASNLDVVYNYGAFDFNTDNFYLLKVIYNILLPLLLMMNSSTNTKWKNEK